MLSHLKNYFKVHGHDIFIVVVIILIALIFFGLGRLSAPNKQPVILSPPSSYLP
jgi:hypothetical protein